MTSLSSLINTVHAPGVVEWIGRRGARKQCMTVMEDVQITLSGLAGDHSRPGKRAVTLIQAEHLAVIAALCGKAAIPPEVLRRNLVVSGINLIALKGRDVRIGGARLRWTTVCAPCSRMEAALGAGGYSAMRGHGGWCAEVVEPGAVAIGDNLWATD